MTIETKILKAMAIFSLISTSYLFSFSFAVAEARLADVSIGKERELAMRAVRQVESDPEVLSIKENPDLFRIQKEIVDGNKDILWFRDASHDYGLRPIKEIEYDATGGKRRTTAFNCSDGHIFVSTSFHKANRPSTIYNDSSLASTIAHEIAHWKNDQRSRCTDAQQKDFALEADLSSLDYMDGTLFYGYGGRLIALHRFVLGQGASGSHTDPKHVPPNVAYNYIADYISDASKGRIQIDINGNCTYDGKPLVSYNNSKMAPDNIFLDVVAEERTMYVSGQIAFAIKYGVWNMERKHIVTQDDIFHNKSKKIVMLVDNPKAGGHKIIDMFDIEKSRWLEIMNAEIQKDEDFFDSLDEEEKYFLQLWRSA